jgi:hypothetical protein
MHFNPCQSGQPGLYDGKLAGAGVDNCAGYVHCGTPDIRHWVALPIWSPCLYNH